MAYVFWQNDMTDQAPPPFDALWFKTIVGFVLGVCLGSFTTMLSYRVPRRLSIIQPSSQCPKCHTPLKALDLIPLFSWIAGRGKCRYCGHAISPRYLFIETATAFLSAVAFAIIGFSPIIILALLIIIAFVTLVTIQLERKKRGF